MRSPRIDNLKVEKVEKIHLWYGTDHLGPLDLYFSEQQGGSLEFGQKDFAKGET